MQDNEPQQQPGWVFTPGQPAPAPPPPAPDPAPSPPQATVPSPPPPPESASPPPLAAYSPQPTAQPTDDDGIAWTASEYVANHKTTGWFVVLGVAATAFAGAIYLLTSDIISSGVILLVAVIFGVLAARQPRVLEYAVDQNGIHIGNKSYPYGEFKSFSIMQEEGIRSIWLMPLRRFMPGISVYYSPDDEAKIIDALADYLPVENREHDLMDRLMHHIRF